MKKYEMKCYEGYEKRIAVTADFIVRNNLGLTKTQEEIVEKIKKSDDFLGSEQEVLLDYAQYDFAREYLTDEAKEKYDKDKTKWTVIEDIKETVQDFLDYMVFAWMKAMDERGLSAIRSVSKLGAWLWLLGREDLCEIIHDDALYNPYGSPALIKVCEELGIEVPEDLIEFSKKKCSK